MKIAFHAPAWPPGSISNGIVTYTSQLVPSLRKLGHTVFVLTGNKMTDDDDPSIIDLRQYFSTGSLWDRAKARFTPAYAGFERASSPIALAIAELVKTQSLDIFEMEESGGWNYATSRLKLLPVVVRLHGPWFLTGKFDSINDANALNRGRRSREGRGLHNAQLVSSPSAKMLEAVKNYYGLDRTETCVIPNAIEAVPLAESWNSETCDHSLLFVGRFDALKGGDLVLRAFAELAAIYPKLTLTFVGTDAGVAGPDGKTLFFEQYMRSNFSEECRSRIKFRGRMSHSDVMSLRPRHFATIVASQQEIMPYSVLEAMSVGCPVIATAVGGIPDLIQHERNGLLVPSSNAQALAAACRRLLDDPALAGRLGRQAWQDCRDQYSPDRIAQQTVAAYAAAIDKFKTRNRRP